MKESLNKTVTMMGYPEGTYIKFLFDNMHTTIDQHLKSSQIIEFILTII